MNTRARRYGWWIAMAGVVAGLLVRAGGLALSFRESGGTPSFEQLGFLAASVLAIVGLVTVIRSDRSVVTRGLTEAATLTTGALALLMWVAIAQPYVVRAPIAAAHRAVAEASLVADLGLAVLLVCFFSRRAKWARASSLLALGVACHVLTDIGYVVVSAQNHGAAASPQLRAVLVVYALFGVAMLRTRRPASNNTAPAEATAMSISTAFDPLVAVVLVNSVTVVLAAVREDRVGALLVAAAALVLTAIAARAQWQLHASNEEALRVVEAERADLQARNEWLSEEYAAKSETLATTSHFLSEMTTRIAGPLNGVLEATDRLHDGRVASDQHEDVAALVKCGGVLLSVVNELVGVSEGAAAAPTFVDTDFSLRSAVDNAVAVHADAAAAKQIELVAVIDDNVPEMVSGDSDRFADLLGIFMDNAVSYTRKGSVSVGVSLIEMRDQGEFVLYVAVNDTGVGLSPYDCYRAFEPDVRVDPHRRRYRGKARGLTKARALVEKFGGLCGVESHLGDGASFWFTVALHTAADARERAAAPLPVTPPVAEPVVQAERIVVAAFEPHPEPEPVAVYEPEPEPVAVYEPEPEVAAVYEPEPAPEPEPEVEVCEPEPVAVYEPELEVAADEPEPETRYGYLLFAEDDPLCRRITVAALRRAGYRVDTVTNGVDTVTAVADRQYDLVLMDCQLPVMTGLEAAAAIRASAGANSRVPIIAVSAFTTERDQASALAAGMDGFLQKPLDIDELLATLDRWAQHVMA